MQQWEYLEVYLFGNQWFDSAGRRGTLPMVTARAKGYFSDRTGYPHAPLLSEVGAQGWELSGVGASGDACLLYFKRPAS